MPSNLRQHDPNRSSRTEAGRRLLAIVACGLAWLTLAAGVGGTETAPTAKRPLAILFIGNSYTSVNNLPGIVEEMAASAGFPKPVRLHGGDGSHPNPAGSYLAGLVVFATIYQTPPDSVRYLPKGVASSDAAALQKLVMGSRERSTP